jgi:hypothetical protein
MYLVEVQEVLRRLSLPDIVQAREEVEEVLQSTTVRMLAMLETRSFALGTFTDDFMVSPSYRGIDGLFPLRLSRPFVTDTPVIVRVAKDYKDLSTGDIVDDREIMVQKERGFVSIVDQPVPNHNRFRSYYVRVQYEAGLTTYLETLESGGDAEIFDEVPDWLQDLAFMSASDLYHRRPDSDSSSEGGFPLPDYYHALLTQHSRVSSFALKPLGS